MFLRPAVLPSVACLVALASFPLLPLTCSHVPSSPFLFSTISSAQSLDSLTKSTLNPCYSQLSVIRGSRIKFTCTWNLNSRIYGAENEPIFERKVKKLTRARCKYIKYMTVDTVMHCDTTFSTTATTRHAHI